MLTATEIVFEFINPAKRPEIITEVRKLLAQVDLEYDSQIQTLLVARHNDQLIACAGLDHNVVKCVAMLPSYQGCQLSLKLCEYIQKFAADKGYNKLFLYTKPHNEILFRQCGFYPLVTVPETLVIMENTPVGIKRYCQQLSALKQDTEAGAIVMNANPFTRGHLYLVEQALKQVSWLYIFVVSEDASLFATKVRYDLVCQGVQHLSRVSVILGSAYLISRATFPTYFLKTAQQIEQAYLAVDLLMFRNYIAPTLNITQRFVGTEPYSVVTCAYNQAMHKWLTSPTASTIPPIAVHELERLAIDGDAVSASRVRKLLAQKDYAAIENLVPPTTWAFLKNNNFSIS
jgi:[citrate (pro-3S)-lyase] ligase